VESARQSTPRTRVAGHRIQRANGKKRELCWIDSGDKDRTGSDKCRAAAGSEAFGFFRDLIIRDVLLDLHFTCQV